MKTLKFYDGTKYCKISEDYDEGTFISFDEEKQIAKVHYSNGDHTIIKSPYMTIEEYYDTEHANRAFELLSGIDF